MSARHAVTRSLASPDLAHLLAHPLHIVAAGKAAGAMASAAIAAPHLVRRIVFAVGTHRPAEMPRTVEWQDAAHPFPDHRSQMAAERALAIAAAVPAGETLLLLLSGGASSVMAAPVDGLQLNEKQSTIRAMLLAGADIHALNTVRKHLSRVKGGRLAAACPGFTLTLAISDVIGDDLSVIGSGPGVADPTTWADVVTLLDHYGEHGETVRALAARGAAGRVGDTPKADQPEMARTAGVVIASRAHALAAAQKAAEDAGYHVVVLDGDVSGEARVAAREWLARVQGRVNAISRPLCVVSAGETTVRVTGRGKGGRNQEFALALAEGLGTAARDMVFASVGTDGIDGPTDAAGALVDRTTAARAAALGLDAGAFLHDNDAYSFFAPLGDLIHLGPTDTNVGDVQILLAAPSAHT